MSKADAAAYSAAASAEGEGATGSTTPRKVLTATGTTVTSMGSPSAMVDASMTSVEMDPRITTSTTASSPAANVGSTIGASTVSGPLTTSPASSAPRTSTSASVSQKTGSGDGGGTPLDVGQQGVGVSKRAGSSLCLVIALVAVVYL